MLRLVVDDEGQIWPDLMQRLPGRGAWLCMQQSCLADVNDRRLQPLKANFNIAFPQWDALQSRIEQVLAKQIRQMFAQQRITAEIGRDAVMHRMWNNAPLLMLLAADAGEALVRQLDNAIAKRHQAGQQTRIRRVVSRLWLGDMLGRDEVAVAAWKVDVRTSVLMDRLAQYCDWYGHIRVR